MKFAVFTMCCLALLVVVAADAGKFIPKSFYTLDAEGHKSDVHPISPHTANYLSRMRRTITVQSTSTNKANGGPVKFTTSEAVIDPPDNTRTDAYGVPVKGHIVTTTGVIDKDGKVTSDTKEGFF